MCPGRVEAYCTIVEMSQNDAIANGFITAIINNFDDDDEDVRAASVQALCELAKHSKKAHAVLILL
jgi:hypothetical protein